MHLVDILSIKKGICCIGHTRNLVMAVLGLMQQLKKDHLIDCLGIDGRAALQHLNKLEKARGCQNGNLHLFMACEKPFYEEGRIF